MTAKYVLDYASALPRKVVKRTLGAKTKTVVTDNRYWQTTFWGKKTPMLDQHGNQQGEIMVEQKDKYWDFVDLPQMIDVGNPMTSYMGALYIVGSKAEIMAELRGPLQNNPQLVFRAGVLPSIAATKYDGKAVVGISSYTATAESGEWRQSKQLWVKEDGFYWRDLKTNQCGTGNAGQSFTMHAGLFADWLQPMIP